MPDHVPPAVDATARADLPHEPTRPGSTRRRPSGSGPAMAVLESGAPEEAALATELGLPRCLESDVESGIDLLLAFGPAGLELRAPGERPGLGIRLDVAGFERLLRQGGVRRGEPLARALGRPPGRVVDATAGLGGDALRCAALGAGVVAFERHPVLHALLRDGLRRVRQGGGPLGAVADRIELRQGDAIALLATLEEPPDVVFIDPMFPPKRRASALPPKAMQRLRAVVGEDVDATALVCVARAHARRRVVVKRPDHAAPLADDPVSSHRGKLVRYDVYRPLPGSSPETAS